ncbi:MAG: hypothetical protein JWR79_124 [Tardiphaga sp.]|nr:hypothetical protein [Tardiphaga sp.]
MSQRTPPARFLELIKRFGRNDRGNIAVIFAIALLPILGFVGVAVDYTRASSARSAMQAALDSTSLMVLKDVVAGAITASEIPAKAQSYFNALYNNKNAAEIGITTTYTAKNSSGTSSVSVNGTAQVNTDFLKVAGFTKLGISSGSTATMGGTRMRVAMALDVTGSMNDANKLVEMKKAANGLITTLTGLATSNEDVYISIVPFAQMVNVGVTNKSASWLNWDELGSCSSRYDASFYSRFNTKDGCQANGGTWTSTTSKARWTGCITDRDQPYDTTKDGATNNNTDFPAVFYTQNGSDICPAEILPMTSLIGDTSNKIGAKIDSLVAAGGTNQAIGIQMAWQTLQSSSPFGTPAKDSNFKYTDVLIILSDGLNTIDRWYGDGSNVSQEVDARQTILCQNINSQVSTTDQEYRVYTIQVNTDGDPTSTVLANCASKNGQFFPTSSAAGIATAFSSIGSSLSKLRIAQ